MWGLIIFLVLINGIQYFFKIDVQTAIKNLFLGKPEIDIKISPEDEVKTSSDKKKSKSSSIVSQVFNIPGNEYTFEEAKALCKAYGSEQYNQIEDVIKQLNGVIMLVKRPNGFISTQKNME